MGAQITPLLNFDKVDSTYEWSAKLKFNGSAHGKFKRNKRVKQRDECECIEFIDSEIAEFN